MATLDQYRPLSIDISDEDWEMIVEIINERIALVRQGDLVEMIYAEVLDDLLDEIESGMESI